MINAIIGDVVRVQEGEVILRAGYVEYTLSVSAQTTSKLSNLSLEERKAVRLLTVLVHREDSMSLFGFYDEAEREAFLQLQTVSGIGSKQALKILSGISVKHLAEALDTGNLKLLSSIPGIGPKTGQKMILALRNVLVFEDEGGKTGVERTQSKTGLWSDIVNALVDMGYDRRRVEEVIDGLSRQEAEAIGSLSHHDAEQLLFRSAVKLLG
ncbi:MAG: Holliday junction branch migration protein RuvA [Sphaerochaeta sp.]|jgi:Holliday junction DNA helicase RuvA|uniref:Holliday junction branch migration protein RuvA n=1 Tax=unclassified Sphaerochaeta TaxID=2637943 RepID=UPI0025E59E96|nr:MULTISPECIES: Holliday junction branch migration protein RuvA [unclassified Sphaerochaeta]MCK9600385.1 Holliday junction branch migration protein RuvA [Sphaerochaeta sp.]MDX9824990.1 Holliday junction branch migration protein RuvA [Sphaerochaeta sp.]HPE93258.1 Holliday junction branch migration protein RuvA [Sphaerochaeta sp.]